MILLGNKKLGTEQTFFITDKKQIESSLPNSTVLFDFDLELMKYCQENEVAYGVILKSIKEAIYANNIEAKYIICEKTLAIKLQDIATNYMFDSKILAIIEDDDEIEEIALKYIDGIVYKSILKA